MSRKFYKHRDRVFRDKKTMQEMGFDGKTLEEMAEIAEREFAETFATGASNVMVNTGEILDAVKANMAELGEVVAAGINNGEDINHVRARAFYVHGAIAGMVNLMVTLGIYTPERAQEIRRYYAQEDE